jgi:protein O-mannosyl-transferase
VTSGSAAATGPTAGEPRGGTPHRGRNAWLAAGVVLLGLFAYANSLHGELVYDDLLQVRENPLIRDLGSLLSIEHFLNERRLLGLLTFALNYRWGGLETTGYHAVNLAIHITASLLVYLLVLVTFRTPRLSKSTLGPWRHAVAFVAAALFVSHPLQTQAVTYVAQRFTSLATLLFLASVLLYARWRLDGDPGRPARMSRWGWLGLALLADVAAMRTKEIAIALPFALLLYEVYFLDGPWSRRAWYLLPFALTLPIIPLGYLWGSRIAVSSGQPDPLSRGDYLITQIAVVATYVGMLFLPVGQALDHHFPTYGSLLAPRVALSAVLLLALLAGAAAPVVQDVRGRTSRRDPAFRMVSFGIAWFFLGLAPQSTFIPIPDVFVEHRLYLASVGAALAAAAGLGLLLGRLRTDAPPRTIILAGLAASLLLATATMQRNEVWRTELSVWRDSAEKSPGTSRAHANYGTVLLQSNRPEEGLAELRRAVDLSPDWAWPRAQLGAALLQLGRVRESETELRGALALDPKDPEACFNLGVLLARTGRRDEARRYFETFLAIAPKGYDQARRTAAGFVGRDR